MPTFPAGATLIVRPSNWYSLFTTPTLVSGGSFDSTNYPLSALTDGSAGEASFRFDGVNGSVLINLNSGNTKTPNIFGVFGHNLDVATVNVKANTTSDMSSPLLNQGVGVRFPGFWLDLRGFNITADYWQLNFSGNSKAGVISEIVVAYGDVYSGILQPNYRERVIGQVTRAEMEYGKIIRAASGSITREMDLTLELPRSNYASLIGVYDEAGPLDRRVIVVPDSRRNDIWLIEWPNVRTFTFSDSVLSARVELPLREEAMGAY